MIIDVLREIGPCLSTNLAAFLIQTHGLSPAAARQRISRAPAEIRRLDSLPFAHSAKFMYLKGQYLSTQYWENLYEAILSVDGAYSKALAAVLAREVMPVHHFLIACGAPIVQKRHIAGTVLLARLKQSGVLVERTLPGLGPCVMTKQTSDGYGVEVVVAAAHARLMAESVLLDSIKEWLRNLALASFNSVCIRRTAESPIPSVGTFNWDLSAPSYSTALTEWSRGVLKPGFIACDVLLTDQVSLEGIKPFLSKVKTLQALRNIGRVMFIMVGQRFDKDAFAALRSAGVLPATPESLFGKDIAKAFRDLIGTLSDAIQGAVDASKLDSIIGKLGKLEGALGNMRGSFFELLVAEVVRKTFPGEVQLNKICTGEDGNAEVDVWAVKEGISARFIECKGMAPGAQVSDEEIEKWLTTRIKRVRYHLKNHVHWDKPKPQFELWTSGKLSDEALLRIEKTRYANRAKYDLVVVNSEGIRKAAKLANDDSLLNTLEHHFIPDL